MDSSPCAEDHSSPRSPRHVLRIAVVREGSPCTSRSSLYNHVPEDGPDRDRKSASATASYPCSGGGYLNVQTHSATSIDVRIEATSPTVGGDTLHCRRFGGVLLAKSQGELEEAEFVGSIGWADDECFEISDINITTGHGESLFRSEVSVSKLLAARLTATLT